MHVSSLLIVAAFGITFGWQPASDDPHAYEVTAQIEPELLDALKAGRTVPIESHVPAEVNPIRNIRVVVGKAELPRTALKPVAKSNRIVRGQGDVPLSHTSLLATDDGWSTTPFASGSAPAATGSRSYDQRNATIGGDAVRTAQTTSPWDRTTAAATETGSGLRDGVEAGIQQANQQTTQLGNSAVSGANDLSRGFNQGLQDLSTSTQSQLKTVWPAPPPSVATSAASAASQIAPVLPPPPLNSPTLTSSTTPTSSSGWSIVRTDVAPPQLLVPPLTNTPAPTTTAASIGGPAFPTASQTSAPFHSLLVDPATQLSQAQSTAPNWSSGWGSQAEANQTQPLRSGPQIPTAGTNDRYSQPTAPSATQDPWANWAKTPPSGVQNNVNQQPFANSQNQAPQNATLPAPPTVPNSQYIGYANGNQPNTNQPNPGLQPASPEVPWKPLLAVSLALAGSIGANFYLGWSYADARHRYHTLARKTTNSFHRAVGAAA